MSSYLGKNMINLILILFAVSPIFYLFSEIVDEDENYKTYLLQDGDKTYLVVQKRKWGKYEN